MRKKLKNVKGITLIALVITIIVLLILAGVSLRLMVGEQGILERARIAVEKSEEAEENEEKELKKGEKWLDQYMPEFKEVDERSLTRQVKPEHYGDSVNYSVEVNGVVLDDWKIFYNDGNEVTLIYGGYLPNSTNLAEEARLRVKEEYIVYEWSGRVIDTLNSLTEKNLWKNLLKGTIDLQDRAQANGATNLQTWVASWNAKGYSHLSVAEASELGEYEEMKRWYIGKGEDVPEKQDVNLSDDQLGYADKLYFPYQESVSNCEGYWIANYHSKINSENLIYSVRYSGRVADYILSDGGVASATWGVPAIIGLRPVIRLSADVLGEKIDGVWNME